MRLSARGAAGLVALAVGGCCVSSSVYGATHQTGLAGRQAVVWVEPSPTHQASPGGSRCTIRGDRPDPVCTPGALNPAVTQATIRSTICVSGWTAKVRPPTSYTGKLKRQQIIEYGYADRDPSHYEEDHLIPLELGGAPRDPRNLWPEPDASPNPKDADENRIRQQVCAGKLTLTAAQAKLLARWGPPPA